MVSYFKVFAPLSHLSLHLRAYALWRQWTLQLQKGSAVPAGAVAHMYRKEDCGPTPHKSSLQKKQEKTT